MNHELNEASWRWQWLTAVLDWGDWVALADGGLLVRDSQGTRRLRPEDFHSEAVEELLPHRSAEAYVLLADSRVLATGGAADNGHSLASTALLEPARTHWSPGPTMRRARHAHAVVRLSDNRVLIAGGFDQGEELADVELFDPGDMKTQMLRPMVQPLSRFWLSSLGGSSVLALGRSISRLHPPQRYDAKEDRWHSVAYPPSGLTLRGSPIALRQGLFVVAQGTRSGPWRYDAEEDRWIELQPPPSWRAGSPAMLRDGRILLVSEDSLDVWLCHPESNLWRPGPSWHRPRRAQLVPLADHRIFAFDPDADGLDARVECLVPRADTLGHLPGNVAPATAPIPEPSERESLDELHALDLGATGEAALSADTGGLPWDADDSFHLAELRGDIHRRPFGDEGTRNRAEHFVDLVAQRRELGIILRRTGRDVSAAWVSRPVVPIKTWGGVDEAALLPVLLHAPSMRQLRALSADPIWPRLPENHPLRMHDDELRATYLQEADSVVRTDGRQRLDWVLRGLSSVDGLPRLRYLRIGPQDLPAELRHDAVPDKQRSRGAFWLGEARHLLEMTPSLGALRIVANAILIGELKSAWLEDISLLSGSLSSLTVRGLARSTLPRLRRLWLGLGCAARAHPEDTSTATPDDVDCLLNSVALASVRELGLLNSPDMDILVAALIGSQVLKQLERLDLSLGLLTDQGAERMLSAAESFRSLKQIQLPAASLSESARKSLHAHFGPMVQFAASPHPP